MPDVEDGGGNNTQKEQQWESAILSQCWPNARATATTTAPPPKIRPRRPLSHPPEARLTPWQEELPAVAGVVT